MLKAIGWLGDPSGGLAQMQLAGGTPGQHLLWTEFCKALQRVALDTIAPAEVALGTEVRNATAMIHAPKHLVIQLHRLQDIHDIEDDVRRAQDIAAEIEDDISARFHRRREAGETPILLWHHLGAGEEPDRLCHALEVGVARRGVADARGSSACAWPD